MKIYRRSIFFVWWFLWSRLSVAISANPKYDEIEIVEIFETECGGNA